MRSSANLALEGLRRMAALAGEGSEAREKVGSN
jgi:hypothetical protein